MKEAVVVLACIVLLTGVQFTVLYSHISHVLVNFVIGGTIGLGVVGLYSMHQSLYCRDKNKRWLLLIVGFFSVLIAYVTLEGLL